MNDLVNTNPSPSVITHIVTGESATAVISRSRLNTLLLLFSLSEWSLSDQDQCDTPISQTTCPDNVLVLFMFLYLRIMIQYHS